MAEARVNYTQWLKRGNSTFIPTDNAKTVEKLEAGIYNIRWADGVGYYMFKKDLKLDELLELPMPESKEVLSSIKEFWRKKDLFKKYDFVYKRGLLLYGSPGTGKTSLINLLCKHLTKEMDGVVFVLTTESDLTAYENVMPEIYRIIEPDRPIITLIEDIDGLCESKSIETRIINILDGIEQLENVVYIATTNYMERLSERLTNRPNRFDRRIEVKSPNYECRRMYFEHKLKADDLAKINIHEWCTKTEGLTLSHLGEIIKSVVIFNHSIDEIIEILKEMKNVVYSRNYNKAANGGIGFSKEKYLKESEEEDVPYEEHEDAPKISWKEKSDSTVSYNDGTTQCAPISLSEHPKANNPGLFEDTEN